MIQRTLSIAFLFLSLHLIVLSQLPTTQNGEALTLTTECETPKEFQLRLRNHTDWPVAVETFSFYYNPLKYKTLKLTTGVQVSAMPNDKEITSLFYYVEKEVAPVKGKRIIEVQNFATDSYSISWIAPNDSIMFRVAKRFLPENAELYVNFNYDWELDGKNHFPIEGNVHRVYYRGDSANHREDPPPCKTGK
jgi:hypothetical protein